MTEGTQTPSRPAGAPAAPPSSCPRRTCVGAGRRSCRSCCGWRRCAALLRVAQPHGARLRRAHAGDLHRPAAQAGRQDRLVGHGGARGRRRRTTSPSPSCSWCCCSPRRACTPTGPRGPGLPKIVTALFQATLVALIYALIATDREQYSSYYIFYGTLLLRDRLRRLDPARLPEASPGWLLQRGRLPAPRGAGRARAATSRRVAHALARRGQRADRDARLHLADAAARQRAALARADRRAAAGARRARRPGGHHRRPGLPGGPVRRAGRPVPPPRRPRAHRAVDDGDPRSAARSSSRARRCRCSSCARRSSRASTTSSSARSTSSARCCC